MTRSPQPNHAAAADRLLPGTSERLSGCREYLGGINKLCEMHPSDLNPTLKMVKMLWLSIGKRKRKTSKTATQKSTTNPD